MTDNEFLISIEEIEEIEEEIEETLEDANKLIVRLIKLKFNLRNCQTHKDFLKYYNDYLGIEEGLEHIILV